MGIDVGGCNIGGDWESGDFDTKEEGCDKEDGIPNDVEGGDTEEDTDKTFGGKMKGLIHLQCLPGWQLVHPFFCLAQEQLLQCKLLPLHLQHGIVLFPLSASAPQLLLHSLYIPWL